MLGSRALRRRVNFAIAFGAALIVVGCSAYKAPIYDPTGAAGLAREGFGSSPAPSLLVTLPTPSQLAFVDPQQLQIQTLLPVPGKPTDIEMHPTHLFAFLEVDG